MLFTEKTRITVRNESTKLRKTGEHMKFITIIVKHPPAVMLWRALSANDVGRIRFLKKGETCNSAWYLKY